MNYKIYNIEIAPQTGKFVAIVSRFDGGLIELPDGARGPVIVTAPQPSSDEAREVAKALIDAGEITRAQMP